MRSLILGGLAGMSVVAGFAAHADEPAPPYTLTANVYLVSDYYFRGLTQTWHDPAIQGGADFVHSSGWYAGVWGSNVSSNQYPGGSSLELDYYGGYNGKINDDWGWTVGVHGYAYPGADFHKSYFSPASSTDYDTFEWNAGLSYKWMSVKYSRQITDWFGVNKDSGYDSDSKGSNYLEFNAAYEVVPTWTVNFHAARTDIKTTLGGKSMDYQDYLIGVSKSFDKGWTASLAYVKSVYDNDAAWKPLASLANTDTLSDPGEGKFIASVGRTF
jgi:uncharacterized protein (TIGR02001 family)